MDTNITIHIADDHQILIDGIIAVLSTEKNLEVTGYSLNGLEVVDWFTKNHADVLILDINMPELDGISVLKVLETKDQKPKIMTKNQRSLYSPVMTISSL